MIPKQEGKALSVGGRQHCQSDKADTRKLCYGSRLPCDVLLIDTEAGFVGFFWKQPYVYFREKTHGINC